MRNLFFIVLASFLFVACASNTPKKGSSTAYISKSANHAAHSGDSLLHIKGNPNRDIAHESFLRGLAWRNANNVKVAEPFYKRALAHEPGNRFLAYDLVEILMENGKSKEALAIAQKAASFPGENSGREYYLLARLHRETNKIDSAKFYYEKVVQSNPEHFRALYEYSIVLEMQQDFKNLARIYDLLLPLLNYPRPMVDKQLLLLKLKGNDSLVVEFLSNAYAAHPEAELGQELTSILLERKRFDEALALAEQMTQVDSVGIESLRNLVRVAVRAGKAPEAIAAQKRLFQADTSNLDELERLGLIEFETNALDSAKVHFQQLLKLRPSDHLAWFYMSNLHSLRRDSVLAMEAIQRAIALKPDAIAYRNHQAALYAHSRDYVKAHQVLDAALVLQKEHPLILQYKANTYIHEALLYEKRKPAAGSADAQKAKFLRENASTWYALALKQDTLAADIRFSFAANLERLDSVSKAVAEFDRLLRMDPTNHPAMNYLGYTLVDRKIDIARGSRLIDSALAINPGNDAYLDSKAWALYRQGDFKGARQILQYLVNDLKSDDSTIWEHLAEACTADKDLPAAQAAWKQVLRLHPRHEKALKATKP